MTEYNPEDYIQYRITRAQETMKEVRMHIENENIEYLLYK